MREISNTQQLVERTFEKAIYDILLREGYIPNRLNYTNDYQGYVDAKGVIAQDKGFAIEVFGHGSTRDRQIKEVPRVVITGTGFYTGSVGDNFPGSMKANGDGTFNKEAYKGTTSTYRVEVTLISQTSTQDRILEQVRQAALPNLTFLSFYNAPDVRFPITYGFVKENNDNNHRIIERTYIYEALDVEEQGAKTISTNIPPISNIDLDIDNT